jgi:hypothetical protein
VHFISDLTSYDSRDMGNDDQTFSSTLIFNESSRTAKSAKLILMSPANIHDVTLLLNFPQQPGNVYAIPGAPFKKFNRLLLYPFHGFW